MAEVQVPNLPGFIDNDVKGTSFNKSHIFDNINGMPVVDKKRGPELCSKPSETITIPAGTEFHAWSKDLGQPDMSETTKRVASSLNELPKWILFDKAVLCFSAWSEEPVLFSNEESSRIRFFKIYYYLDDDTIHISEKAHAKLWHRPRPLCKATKDSIYWGGSLYEVFRYQTWCFD
eukprot:UN22991